MPSTLDSRGAFLQGPGHGSIITVHSQFQDPVFVYLLKKNISSDLPFENIFDVVLFMSFIQGDTRYMHILVFHSMQIPIHASPRRVYQVVYNTCIFSNLAFEMICERCISPVLHFKKCMIHVLTYFRKSAMLLQVLRFIIFLVYTLFSLVLQLMCIRHVPVQILHSKPRAAYVACVISSLDFPIQV